MKFSKLFLSMCLTVAACFGACFAINASRSETIEVEAGSKYQTRIKYDPSDYSIPYVLSTGGTQAGQPSASFSFNNGTRFVLAARKTSTRYHIFTKPNSTVENRGTYDTLSINALKLNNNYTNLPQADDAYSFFAAQHINDDGLLRFVRFSGNPSNPSINYTPYLCARGNPNGIAQYTQPRNYDNNRQTYQDAADFRVEYVDGRVRLSTSFVDDGLPFSDPIYLAFDGTYFRYERPGEESLDSDRYLFWVCKVETCDIKIKVRLCFDFDVTVNHTSSKDFESYTNFRNAKIQFRLDSAFGNETWKYGEKNASERGLCINHDNKGKMTVPFSGCSEDDLTADGYKLYFSTKESTEPFTVGIMMPQERWKSSIQVLAILRSTQDRKLFSCKSQRSVWISQLLNTYRLNEDGTLSEREASVCSSFYWFMTRL